jgi:predicted nucleic acid-binding protein
VVKILLDSDVIIQWLRGRDPCTREMIALIESHADLCWTPVSIAEILAGSRKSEEGQIAELFLVLEALPLTVEIGQKAGAYLRTYAKSHSVELGDALIAATAWSSDRRLWTLNRKHYPMRDIRFFSYGSPA